MITLTVPASLRSPVIIIGAVVIGAYVIFGGPSDIRKRKRRKDNVPGLANIGNSCFLNALVQSLASCPLFVSWLGSKHQDPSPPLVSALHKLLQVLNNGGDHKGDACAGEVMCALRGHGWVISTEEQDAHELFHAVAATIDEELIHADSLPSLLDVSWMEADSVEASHRGDDGVVFKSDCWRQSRSPILSEIENQGILRNFISKVENLNIGTIDKSELVCDASSTSEVVGEDSRDYHAMKLDRKRTEVIQTLSTNSCKYKSSCDDKGCENGVITNGHYNGDSSPVQKCETGEKEDGRASFNCDSHNKEDGAVFIHQNGNIDSYCETEECVTEKVPDQLNANSKSGLSCEEDVCSIEKDETKRKLSNTAPITKSKKRDVKWESDIPTWKTQSKHHDSPFQGYLASQLQCTLCGYKNPAQWTSFESLSLSLPSLPWGEVTLQELLDSYITQEKVTDVTCDACTKKAGVNVKTAFTKQLTIGKLPNCLCFHIKRTVWMENGSAVKRQDHVIFPEFLTMDPYTYVTSVNSQGLQSGLLGGREASIPPRTSVDCFGNICPFQPSSVMSLNATSTEIEASPFFRVTRVRCEQLYRLKAVIVHVGDVFCGHFVTYRRGALGARTRNRWFYTSDLTVRESNLEEVRKANAYMILYEKVSE